MADYPDVWKAVYSKLANDGTVASLVSTRVFDQFVPLETERPFIVFYHAAGGPENRVPRETIDVTFRVEAVAETGPEAKAVYNALYAALHDQALTITGWSVFWTKVSTVSTLVDLYEGRQHYRRIADVRIRASED